MHQLSYKILMYHTWKPPSVVWCNSYLSKNRVSSAFENKNRICYPYVSSETKMNINHSADDKTDIVVFITDSYKYWLIED